MDTQRQGLVTFHYDPLAASALELLGHVANPYPTAAETHGLWNNGGRRLTLYVRNPTESAFQVMVYRRATPDAGWSLEATINVLAGTTVNQVYDLGGYAVRAILFSNSVTAFDFDVSAVIQSVSS